MAKQKTLTHDDMKTIRSALSYAVADRDSFLGAIKGTDPTLEKKTKALIARFEKLSMKLFDEPTIYQQLEDKDAATPIVSIHDIASPKH